MLPSVTIMSAEVTETFRDFFVPSKHLQRLIAKTFRWSVKHVDGEKPVSFMSPYSNKHHIASLRKMENDCICSVDRLKRKMCLLTLDREESSRVQAAARLLDEPNFNPLTELYSHCLPAFGNVRNFMKPLF